MNGAQAAIELENIRARVFFGAFETPFRPPLGGRVEWLLANYAHQGGRELFKRGLERVSNFQSLFGPQNRGAPPPLESLRHHLATSAPGGNF